MAVKYRGSFDDSLLEDLKASFVQLNPATTNLGKADAQTVQTLLTPLTVTSFIATSLQRSSDIYSPLQNLAGDGAATVPGFVVSSKGSAAAISVAAPTSGTDDGKVVVIMSSTAFAHVITFTGAKLQNGVTANRTTATFPALAGACIAAVAFGGNWLQLYSVGTIVYA